MSRETRTRDTISSQSVGVTEKRDIGLPALI
jgi:hypothetical protein